MKKRKNLAEVLVYPYVDCKFLSKVYVHQISQNSSTCRIIVKKCANTDLTFGRCSVIPSVKITFLLKNCGILWNFTIYRYLRNDCKTHCDSCYKVRDSCFQLMIKQVHVQLFKTWWIIWSSIIIHSTVLQVLELGNLKREPVFIVSKQDNV